MKCPNLYFLENMGTEAFFFGGGDYGLTDKRQHQAAIFNINC